MAIGSGRSIQHKRIYAFLSLAGTIVLLVWAFRGVSFVSVWHALEEASHGWLVLGTLTFIASFLVRAHRWGILLSTQPRPVSFKIRRSAVFIGFGANQVLPANAGEIIRASVINRFEKVPLGVVLGSLLAARLLDAVVAFLLLLTPLLSLTSSSQTGLNVLPVAWLGILLVVLCVAFWVAANYEVAIARLVGSTLKVVGLGSFKLRIEAGVVSLLSGLKVLRFPKRAAMAVADTLLLWSLSGVTFWTALIAFNIAEPGLSGALFIQSVESMATIIPSSPGHLGAFEAAIRFSLSVYNVSPDVIVAYTLVLRMIMYGSLIVLGFVHAVGLGLTSSIFSSLRSADARPVKR